MGGFSINLLTDRTDPQTNGSQNRTSARTDGGKNEESKTYTGLHHANLDVWFWPLKTSYGGGVNSRQDGQVGVEVV